MPLWRVRGYGDFDLAGHRFRFHGVGRHPYDWWGLRAHRGAWEPATLRRFADVLEPGDAVLDIGAQFGIYTLLASRLVGPSGRVAAFEPDPVARRMLERNVATEGASNVEIRHEAVGERSGKGWLAAERLGEGASTLADGPGGVAVEIVTLADFCARTAIEPDVVKVDVEGGEAGVLAGSSEAMLRRARALFVEIHEAPLAERGIQASALLRAIATASGTVMERVDLREAGNYTAAFSRAPSEPAMSENDVPG